MMLEHELYSGHFLELMKEWPRRKNNYTNKLVEYGVFFSFLYTNSKTIIIGHLMSDMIFYFIIILIIWLEHECDGASFCPN